MKNIYRDRYNLPAGMPQDKWGQAKYAATDPYGELEFVVGSEDDFVCFDYATFAWRGVEYVALHSVLNSETGSFIENFDYHVLPLMDPCGVVSPELVRTAHAMVFSALGWCGDNDVTHDRLGWNQDPFYFVRSLVVSSIIHSHTDASGEAWKVQSRFSHSKRFGGKTVDRVVNRCADAELMILRGRNLSPVKPRSRRVTRTRSVSRQRADRA